MEDLLSRIPVRAVIDLENPTAWASNIYMSWLACLRDLETSGVLVST